MSTSVSFHLLL